MRKLRSLFFLYFFLLSLCACVNKRLSRFIPDTEEWSDISLDSAIFILKQVEAGMWVYSGNLEEDYFLLCINSKGKVCICRHLNSLSFATYFLRMREDIEQKEKQDMIDFRLFCEMGVLFFCGGYFLYCYRRHIRQSWQSLCFTKKNQKRMEVKQCVQELINEEKQKVFEYYETAKSRLSQTDIYKYFMELCDEEYSQKVTEEKWGELSKLVDVCYQNMLGKLLRIHKLSKHEQHVCLLIKIGISPMNIAKITMHSPEAISAVRRRMYEKFFGAKGRPCQWDKFILSL